MYFEKLTAEIEKVADEKLGWQPFGGILKISDNPILAALEPYVDYRSDRWTATRKIVDQLDQVTFGRITK